MRAVVIIVGALTTETSKTGIYKVALPIFSRIDVIEEHNNIVSMNVIIAIIKALANSASIPYLRLFTSRFHKLKVAFQTI